MDQPSLDEQILKSLFKSSGNVSSASVSLKEVRAGFEHVDADTFFDTVSDLIGECLLLDRGRGHVGFSPEGWERAGRLVQPLPSAPKAAPQKKAKDDDTSPLTENLVWLVELMLPNLAELKLPSAQHQKVLEHLANLKALSKGTPNPALVKAVCGHLKSITEGAIGKRLAADASSVIWGAVRALFDQL